MLMFRKVAISSLIAEVFLHIVCIDNFQDFVQGRTYVLIYKTKSRINRLVICSHSLRYERQTLITYLKLSDSTSAKFLSFTGKSEMTKENCNEWTGSGISQHNISKSSTKLWGKSSPYTFILINHREAQWWNVQL